MLNNLSQASKLSQGQDTIPGRWTPKTMYAFSTYVVLVPIIATFTLLYMFSEFFTCIDNFHGIKDILIWKQKRMGYWF